MNKEQKIWNVPNVLTMIRMALIPVFWVLFFTEGCRYWALAVYVIASLTDLADGYIARKYNLITDFGKLMDPLADKLMVLSMMLAWVIEGTLPWVPLAILLLKEALMVVGGIVLLRMKIVVYSEKLGKYAQAMVVLSLVACFFHEWFESIGVAVHLILIWVAVAMALSAFGFYAWRATQRMKTERQDT